MQLSAAVDSQEFSADIRYFRDAFARIKFCRTIFPGPRVRIEASAIER